MWGVNTDFTSYELKWTINAILQHMGLYHTTEDPCVRMRENHKTKSCECIIIHRDELYIATSTLQEILHIVKEKYKIQINPNDYQGSNFPYDPGGTMICQLQSQYDTQQNYISTSYTLNFINSSTIYMISFYTQETPYMKMESKYCIMGSINQAKQ